MTAPSSQCSNVVFVVPSCILTQESDDGSFSVKPLPDVTHTAPHSCCVTAAVKWLVVFVLKCTIEGAGVWKICNSNLVWL